MKSKEELKKLFENGDKPTQENFWEWQDSYWHKDEKLPTENIGLYKIKGSVPDKVALDNMESMVEGDVYNLLDTGANYVYVLDLNNTGIAGWDDFFGMVDLSSINLQTVLDNGSTAYSSDFQNYLMANIENSDFRIGFTSTSKNKTNTFGMNGSSASFITTKDGIDSGSVYIGENGLKYGGNYSSNFTTRSLVDKEYVDNKIKASKGYKNLTALLQFTNATFEPTFLELENNIGNIVWKRTGIGEYVGTLSGAFINNRTWTMAQINSQDGGVPFGCRVGRLTDDQLFLSIFRIAEGNPTNIAGTCGSLEIKIY